MDGSSMTKSLRDSMMATACLVDVAKDASLRPPCETLSQVRANLLGNSSTITFSSGPIKEDHEKKRKLTLISVKDTAETNKRLRLTGWSSNRWRKLWEESVGATSRGGQSVKGGAPGRGGASGWGGATGRGGTSGRGGATVRGGASGKVGLASGSGEASGSGGGLTIRSEGELQLKNFFAEVTRARNNYCPSFTDSSLLK
jgi:hypothetical protein